MKPDLNVKRVLYRLGYIGSTKNTPQTQRQVQNIGERMVKVSRVKIRTVDYVVYVLRAGESLFVKYAVCSKIPRCNECPVSQYCFYEGAIA